MTKDELKNLNWSDISIAKWDDGSPLIILLFKTQKDADGAAINGIGKHPFRIDVSRTAQGTHNFDLVFLDSKYAIRYESKLTLENYPPLSWLTNESTTYVTTGWSIGGGRYNRLAPVMKVDNLQIN